MSMPAPITVYANWKAGTYHGERTPTGILATLSLPLGGGEDNARWTLKTA
jgi:hypothetical protein